MKIFNLVQSNTKDMKKFLFLFAMLPLLFASCAKESSENVDKEESVYYVKYSVKASATNRYINYTNEKGESVQVVNDGEDINFEVVIGPVSRGFECLVSVTGNPAKTRIDCSKDNSPFAYKASGGNSLSYTIDY